MKKQVRKVMKNPIETFEGLKRVPSSKPVRFDLSQASDVARLDALLKSGSVTHVRDHYRFQLRELFSVDNPPLAFSPTFDAEFEAHHAAGIRSKPEWQQGRWIFFPWIGTLVHILAHDGFHRVRTARNRTLISADEQAQFYDATIAIAGLSIGNSVAIAIALQGGGRRMKLADFDTMDLSNLNRIRAGVDVIGLPKTEITARQIYLINPYAEVELFGEGLIDRNIGRFFERTDLVIDEFDNFAIKRLIREQAKARRIPLISGADVGESAVVDIERYDVSASTKPFHGRIPDLSAAQLEHLDKRAIGGMIAQLVGLENHNTRMLEWPKHMGQPDGIVSFPQLGGMALLNGSLVAYCAYAILAGYPIKNGRSTISLEQLFIDKGYFSAERMAERDTALATFKKMFSIP